MNAEILTVGTELLLGDILNSNSQFLSRELAIYGIDILYQSTVGDNRERLESALETALSRCDMVILTGGLGPTEDDLTRETVAAALDLPLELHEESEERIKEYFRATEKVYTENNRKQAMLPRGCTVFRNDHGTAPGCAVEKDGKCVILLPGPPKELVPMFGDSVAPFLMQFTGETIRSHTIGVFGIPEAAVDERLHDLMESENPTVAPYAKSGEVLLRVTAKAATPEAADELCMPIVEEICQRLGNAVYSVDRGGLPETVVALLKESEKKIATAESCTAGLLSGKLTEVPGASQVFECGIAAYSADIKRQVLGVPESVLEKQGVVSPETAGAMAIGARRVGNADIGIGITGVAGPDPSEGKDVGTVYVALADEKRVWVKKIFAGHGSEDREQIRNVATLYALDMSRRYLEAWPGVMAGGQLLEKVQHADDAGYKVPKVRHKSRRWIWFSLILALLIVIGMWVYVTWVNPYLKEKKFQELWAIYMQEKVPEELPEGAEEIKLPSGILSQFVLLYQMNEDVRGWLTIKDSNINYPVMLEAKVGFYVNHDYDRETSSYGVPYLTKGTALAQGKNNRSLVVYGNNPGNGKMFSQLSEYTKLSFLKQHPSIEFNTLFRESEYKIFAVVLVQDGDTDPNAFDYTVDEFESNEEFLEYVAQIRQRSLFDTPVDVMGGDDLLMLTAPIDYSFDDARVLVVARRVREGEDEENDLSKAHANRSVLMPAAWQELNSEKTTTTALTTTVTRPTSVSTVITTVGTESTVTTDTTTTESTGTADSSATMSETTTTETTATETTTVTETVTTTGVTVVTTTETTVTTTTTPTTAEANKDGEELIGETTTKPSVSTTARPTVTRPPDQSEDRVDAVEGTVQGTRSEYDFLSYFVLRDKNDGLIQPKTKEELQMALARLVKSELGSARTMVNSTEAQKAQAIVSYTYVLWYGSKYGEYSCDLKTINLNDKNDKKIYDAVGDVVGVKLLDTSKTAIDDMLLQTTYFAATGGFTAYSNRVWSGSLPYAKSVESKYDRVTYYVKYGGGGDFLEEVTMTRTELNEKVTAWAEKTILENKSYKNYAFPLEQLAEEGEVPLKARLYDGDGSAGVGDAWNYVYHTNFYYVDDRGNQKYLTGYNIRNALGLRSHAFRVEYEPSTDEVTITTQGWGHGVGFSQMGAVGYANEEGWSYVQILRHYFSVTGSTNHQVVMPVW